MSSQEKKRSDKIRLSTFEQIHDPTMERVPEVGYDTLEQWIRPPWNMIIIFFIAICSSAILSTTWFSAAYTYPIDGVLLTNDVVFGNDTDPAFLILHESIVGYRINSNLMIQAFVIFCSLVFVRFCFVKFTGEAQDPFLIISAGVSEMMLHPKYSNGDSGSKEAKRRLTVFVKIIIILLGNLIGWIIGYAVFLSWARNVAPNDSYTTDNCTEINFEAAPCRVYPKYDEFALDDGSATAMLLIGMLLSYASYYIGYTMIRHKEHWMSTSSSNSSTSTTESSKKSKVTDHRNITPLGFAVVSSLGPALAHLVFGPYVGVSHNTFFWLISVIFTRATEQAKVYAWPGIVIGAIVVIAHLVYQVLWTWIKYYDRKKSTYSIL